MAEYAVGGCDGGCGAASAIDLCAGRVGYDEERHSRHCKPTHRRRCYRGRSPGLNPRCGVAGGQSFPFGRVGRECHLDGFETAARQAVGELTQGRSDGVALAGHCRGEGDDACRLVVGRIIDGGVAAVVEGHVGHFAARFARYLGGEHFAEVVHDLLRACFGIDACYERIGFGLMAGSAEGGDHDGCGAEFCGVASDEFGHKTVDLGVAARCESLSVSGHEPPQFLALTVARKAFESGHGAVDGELDFVAVVNDERGCGRPSRYSEQGEGGTCRRAFDREPAIFGYSRCAPYAAVGIICQLNVGCRAVGKPALDCEMVGAGGWCEYYKG